MMNITNTNSTIHFKESWHYMVTPFFVISLHIINILLGLPLNTYVIILLVGRRGRMDPSTIFSLNQAAVEIFFVLLAPFHSMCSINTTLCFYHPLGFFPGVGMTVRSLFQCLVCLERYIAVVHPITFLRLKPLRFRVGLSIMVWLTGLASGTYCMFTFPYMPYKVLLTYGIFILLVSVFCCMSILKKLNHPGPGDREKEKGDGAKKKAFQVVTLNLLTFLIQTIPSTIVFAIQETLDMATYSMALVISLAIFIVLGFLHPVFVLYKAVKLPCRKSARKCALHPSCI